MTRTTKLSHLIRSPIAAGLGALVIGFGVGLALSGNTSTAATRFVDWSGVVGQLWVNALRMVLVPLVVALLMTSVAGMDDLRALGRLGARTLGLFLALLVGTAVVAVIVAPPFLSGIEIDAGKELLGAHALEEIPSAELPTAESFLLGLVPTSPLRAAVDGAMLPLIVFTLLFAWAATRLTKEAQAPLFGFFCAVRDAMLVLMRGVLLLTPLGVFGLSVGLGAGPGLELAGSVGRYLLVICGLQLAVALALYPIVRLAGRSVGRFARAVLPAQTVALGTRSSLASLPALIEGYRKGYGERPGVTGFVLPLCVSTFKLNTPISDLVGPLFLAALIGADLSTAQVAAMALVAVAMSFSNPGIPSGGLFVVTAPVMMSAGLPLEGIGLLIAVDAIPDLCATFLNVTGDMTVGVLADKDT
ncbi:MAG: dicarboxylate/amino acid:cation symporter [Proteobacteria bacterium]|jgi:Na+/H+-dicarboxylate symporter|nr:dicarboxylate/amino acid:cation symporter [Pseudomonadota bacterium]